MHTIGPEILYANVLSTVTGLLARGLAAIGTRGDIQGWRWILIIEGLLVSVEWQPQQHLIEG